MIPKNTQTDNADDSNRGDWLYNFIMGAIEPDLCTWNIGTLDEKHNDETSIEHDARMERYENAFTVFDENLNITKDGFASKAMEKKAETKKRVNKKEKKEREGDIASATEQLESLDSPQQE